MKKITTQKLWNDQEVAQLIALYQFYLNHQLAGEKCTKNVHYKALAKKLGRSVASIEGKLMNVSGVLKLIGHPELIVKGYAPTNNRAKSLISAVETAFVTYIKKAS